MTEATAAPPDPTTGLPPNAYHPLSWHVGQPEIGPGCWIGAFTLIDGSGGLRIGAGCNISSGAQILTHSTVRRTLTERVHPSPERAPTELGEHVFVGTNATILMGCHIGHHSVVAAGAVVREHSRFPPYSVVAGNPAVLKRRVDAEALRDGRYRTTGGDLTSG
jgi:acetyltransferase-like isoleucine patch superfamily enzyme